MTTIPAPHRLSDVVYRGRALEEAEGALVLLHGRGASAASILGLAEALGAQALAVAAPQAAHNRWYPLPFTAPTAQNEPDLSSALSLLGALMAELSGAGIPAERVVIAGFSQGACLASEFVARNPARYGGLLVFSGGLIGTGPEVSAELYRGSLSGTPVFIGCSDRDAHIALERVQKTSAVLRALGASVTERIYPGMAHTIIQEELDEAAGVVAEVAAHA